VGLVVAVDWAKTRDTLARSTKMEVTRADFKRIIFTSGMDER
jgi:hypothetical protein